MHTLEYLCFWKGNVVGLLCVRLPGRGEPVLPPLHQAVRQYDQLCRVLQPQRGERRLRPGLAQPLRRPLLLSKGTANLSSLTRTEEGPAECLLT